mmetsp:Transcript_7387/g.21654  ORF Transcript_7387/g.21654 Transcript_7387/m.21654 type:complete len:241 (-) Transcript_7387:233-955(-)
MLKLCAPFSIRRHGGPIVVPCCVARHSQVDHWLHSEDVANLHRSLGLVLVVMRDVRDGVKQCADSVTAISSVDAAFVRHGLFVDGRTQIAVQRAWPHQSKCGCQTFECRPNKALSVSVDLANTECFVEITVVSAQIVRRHIDVDNVSILNFSVIRNSMTNDFVDAGADRFWEVVVIQRRRVAHAFHACFVDNAINFIRGNAWTQGLAGEVQNFSSHLACVTQTVLRIQLLRRVNSNVVVK